VADCCPIHPTTYRLLSLPSLFIKAFDKEAKNIHHPLIILAIISKKVHNKLFLQPNFNAPHQNLGSK